MIDAIQVFMIATALGVAGWFIYHTGENEL